MLSDLTISGGAGLLAAWNKAASARAAMATATAKPDNVSGHRLHVGGVTDVTAR